MQYKYAVSPLDIGLKKLKSFSKFSDGMLLVDGALFLSLIVKASFNFCNSWLSKTNPSNPTLYRLIGDDVMTTVRQWM
jgi:hypothetical protein